jgi:hypothetical protein
MEESIGVTGLIRNFMVLGYINGKMEKYTWVNTQMIKNMVTEYILYKITELMKAGGLMENNMVLAHLYLRTGRVDKLKIKKESGKMERELCGLRILK